MHRFLLFFLLLQATHYAKAQTPALDFIQYASGLSSPVDLVASPAGNSDLYVVERGVTSGSGTIRIVRNGAVLPVPFLTVTGISCCGERGLLSMVFHPNYNANRTFFVFYTAPDGALTVARYSTPAGTPDQADASSRQVILSIPHPGQSNHNGGKLLFGPDGYLYLGTGDGGGGNDTYANAQNPATLLGKMLRIDPSLTATAAPFYSIPVTNPYASTSDGVRDEIYAMGLRNPWRWSFDRQTGNVWIADVGQGAWEELNFNTPANLPGANFGWRCFEGYATNTAPGIQPCALYNGQPHQTPVFVYPHTSEGGFSVTGGIVYRGQTYPALAGYYIMADYIRPNAWLVTTDGSFTATRQSAGVPSNISSFGEDAAGELYAVALSSGILYKVTTSAALPVHLLSFTAKQALGGVHQLQWQVSADEPGDTYSVETSSGPNVGFTSLADIAAKGGSNHLYKYDRSAPGGKAWYRIRSTLASGSISYSPIISLGGQAAGTRPWSILNHQGMLRIQFLQPAQQVRITDLTGRTLMQQSLNNQVGLVQWQVPNAVPQVYFVQALVNGQSYTEKIWLR